MADLVISSVRIVESVMQYDVPAAEVFETGEALRFDSDGNGTPGNATNTTENVVTGIATRNAERIGRTVTILEDGIADVGDALDALAFGALVFLSDTDGLLADAAGTTTVVMGKVIPGWSVPSYSGASADKLLRVRKGIS